VRSSEKCTCTKNSRRSPQEGGIFGNPEFKYTMSPSWPPEGFEEVTEQIRAEYEEDEE
jgi:hypothetical protein